MGFMLHGLPNSLSANSKQPHVVDGYHRYFGKLSA